MSFLIITLLFGLTILAQELPWTPSATLIQQIYNNIESQFYDKNTNLYYSSANNGQNMYSYLCATSALFQAFEEMQNCSLPRNNFLLEKMFETIQHYYDGVENTSNVNYGGYDSYVVKFGGGQRYYDDNEWTALDMLDAYKITNNSEFLKTAEKIFNFVQNGQDDKLGGGIYWAENGNSKNTCSNGPAIVLALKLYKITHKDMYFNFAKKIYAWTNKNLLSPENLYWDHIDIDGHVNKAEFTYNTGIMIQANVLFYEITNDVNYLNEAKKLAEESLKHFASNGNFPYWDDGSFWFNAVLLRGYQNLYRVDKSDGYIYIYTFDDWMSRVYKSLLDAKSLLYQSGLLEICSRLYMIEHLYIQVLL